MRRGMRGVLYDDIVFHEGNVPSVMVDQLTLEAKHNHSHTLRFVDARSFGAFHLPKASERARGPGLLRRLTGYSIGYRHMCRFFAMQWCGAWGSLRLRHPWGPKSLSALPAHCARARFGVGCTRCESTSSRCVWTTT